MQRRKYNLSYLILLLAVCLASCKASEKYLADPITNLNSRCIKRSLGPNLVGRQIEFAYAMAIPKAVGSLASARVVATIAGAGTTYLDSLSRNTSLSGTEVGVKVASASVNTGNSTDIVFLPGLDTIAATLRYFYVIPEEARGKTVSFTFSVTGSNGRTHSLRMGPYTISNMDIATGINLSTAAAGAKFISITDMRAYTPAQISSDPTIAPRIDLVYLSNDSTINFKHALYSPAAVPGDPLASRLITLPAGMTNNTLMRKTNEIRDRQLSGDRGVYVDDIDLLSVNFANSQNFYVGLGQYAGTWLQTQDGVYRAYLYISTASTPSTPPAAPVTPIMTVNIKRLTIK